jgi:tRNA dimethylallyltransferase
MDKHLIVVCGPTAVGKTDTAIRLAQHFNAEVISADSRQFYREMNAATAKPTPEELRFVKHHFIDSLSIFDTYSAGRFEQESLKRLKVLHEKNDVAIAAGGSGLYLKALTEGLDALPDIPENISTELQRISDQDGITLLQEELKEKDPIYFQKVDIHNPRRLIRALSLIRHTGQPFSSFLSGQKASRNFDVCYVRLDIPRKDLYQRIDQRVDTFFDLDWLTEIRQLYPHRKLKALQTVGYTEMFDWLDGKMTMEEAVDKVKQHSRNYAKRQLTWLNKYTTTQSYHPSAYGIIINDLIAKLYS